MVLRLNGNRLGEEACLHPARLLERGPELVRAMAARGIAQLELWPSLQVGGGVGWEGRGVGAWGDRGLGGLGLEGCSRKLRIRTTQ